MPLHRRPAASDRSCRLPGPLPGRAARRWGTRTASAVTRRSASRTWNRARSPASTSGARRRSAMTSAPPETSMRGRCIALSRSRPQSASIELICRTAGRMRRPPDAPSASHGAPPCSGDHGAHVGQRALAGRHRIGPARARVEPHHAIVEQNAGRRRHDPAAERRQQGLGQTDHRCRRGRPRTDASCRQGRGGRRRRPWWQGARGRRPATPRPRRHKRQVPARRAAPSRRSARGCGQRSGPAVRSARRGEGRAAVLGEERLAAARPVAAEVLRDRARRPRPRCRAPAGARARRCRDPPGRPRRGAPSVSASRPSGRWASSPSTRGAGGTPSGR